MTTDGTTAPGLDDFIRRWEASGAAERANYALFLSELCDVLGVPRPEPTGPDDAHNAYVLERNVPFQNPDGTTTVKRIDLYKRGCFVLEAKQGSDQTEANPLAVAPARARRGTAVRGSSGWDTAMVRARGQAEQYVRNLPASEPNPPFLVVVDVGHTIELYADFTGQGRTYVPFPEARSHRIRIRDLTDEAIRDRLRLVWTDPSSLDPSRRAARVTRSVAERLARLAQSLEASGHDPGHAAAFLMRCLFTFFAEDVGLLPRACFTDLLRGLRDRDETSIFPEMVRALWATMKTGGFSPILRQQVLRFNGGLFENPEALPVTPSQLALLIEAGEHNWRDVEPAIFGTLLERALNPIERHKLGAHYTPRAYVERLVLPTIVEPLRERWSNVQAAALTLASEGDLPGARQEVRAFLDALCELTILDPACGTGNFLYVSLEHLKRLEGEVWDALRGFGETQEVLPGTGQDIDPHQLKGIEINPRAAAIADLVLWIGYLQWNLRTFDRPPAEPIIHAFHNIECRDAVLAYEGVEPLLDSDGKPVTRWDGITKKVHPVTGEDVPDDTARVPVLKYQNPRKAEWPKADYVVGNPPFIGNKRMRLALGDGYVDALRAAWKVVPDMVDFVMYWWEHAADRLRAANLKRFGFITTNSITQSFNRKVVQKALDAGVSLEFAIPDHPWVDEKDGAAVRVAMTCASTENQLGLLVTVASETENSEGVRTVELAKRVGVLNADLTVGVSFRNVVALRSNNGLSFMGVIPLGEGFRLDLADLESMGLSVTQLPPVVRPYLIGKDLAQKPETRFIIDFSEMDYEEATRKYPSLVQRLLGLVKPDREARKGNTPDTRDYAQRWWQFAKKRPEMRAALNGLDWFIVTTETSRHRLFIKLSTKYLPDQKLRVIAMNDYFILGCLSSRQHVLWALATGSRLGVGNDPVYNNSRCFEQFPFPTCSNPSRTRIQEIAEHLDAHRKARQAEHPTLTLTGMYNVLAKLRSGEPLTDKERTIHEQGLVSVLKQIHDDLDAAVFDAYGWPRDLSDDEILRRLVDLNRERAEEEQRGLIRWLRPEFQNPGGTHAPTATQARLPITPDEPAPLPAAAAAKAAKRPWPKTLPEQAQAVRAVLGEHPAGLTPDTLARLFVRARADRVGELLETLVSLGQARAIEGGRFVRA